MALPADKWTTLMRLGLMAIFPPVYHRAEVELDEIGGEVDEATGSMSRAANEVMLVASQLRTDQVSDTSGDMVASIEEVADLL